MNRNSSSWPDPPRWMVSPGISRPSHSLWLPSVSRWLLGLLQLQTHIHNSAQPCPILGNLRASFTPGLEPAVDSMDAGLCSPPVGCTLVPPGTAPGCTWPEVRERPVFPSRTTEFVSSDLGWRSLGKARRGVPSYILAAGYCTWKWKSSLSQEAFPLLFHMAQQHVKDTACHCKS